MLVEVFEFRIDLFDFKSRQALQTHIENRRRLLVAQTVVFHKFGNGVLSVAGFLQKFDDCVDIFKRDMQSEQYVLSFLRFFKVETRSAHDYVLLVSNVAFQYLFEVENARYAVYEREHDHTERRLHLRLLVELIEKNLRVDVLFEFDDDAHAVSVRFFSQIADAFKTFVFDLIGYVFDEFCFVDLIRYLGDDDAALAVCHLFDFRLRAKHARASAGAIRLLDGVSAKHERSRGEIRRGNVFHKVVNRCVGILQERDGGVDNFAEIVRRNGRCHTDCDTVRAVDEQVGESRRQHCGLLACVVEVGIEVNRLFVYVADHFERDLGKTCLGVTIRSGRVAVYRAEVAVSVNERTAYGKVLRKTHHCVVHRTVAVGVIFAKHFTDDHRALTIGLVGSEAKFAHSVKNTSVNGLQTVAYVGDCTGYVDRHRVCDK